MTEKFYLTFEKKFLVFGETEKTLKVLDGNFDFDIEETANFGTRGLNVVVVSNAKGEKLFLKKGKTDKFGNVELDPLTANEIQEYGIVQETCQNSKYYVQETEVEDDSTKKKVKQFDPNNSAEDMRKAKEYAQDQLERLGESGSSGSLKQENEKLKKQLETVASKELSAKLHKEGLNLGDFASAEDAIRALKDAQSHHAPEGGGQNFYHYQDHEPSQATLNQTFDSDSEMRAVLEQKAKSDNAAVAAEAQATLDAIKHHISERIKKSPPLDLTFEGKIVDLALLPRAQTKGESNDDYQAYLKRWRQSRSNWKQKGE